MKEFTMIEKRITEEAEKNTAATVFYIENGYFPTWAEEHRTDPDRGLKANRNPVESVPGRNTQS